MQIALFLRAWAAFALLYVLLILAVLPAHACAPRDIVLAALAKEFSETPVGTGIAKGGQSTTELLLSPKGTWTVLVTSPEGVSCIVSAGEGWSFALPEKEGTAS